MKSLFSQNSDHKHDVRRREERLLSEKKISSVELGEINFCMKGAKLSSHRQSNGSFSLF